MEVSVFSRLGILGFLKSCWGLRLKAPQFAGLGVWILVASFPEVALTRVLPLPWDLSMESRVSPKGRGDK